MGERESELDDLSTVVLSSLSLPYSSGPFFYLYHSTTMIVNSAVSVLCLEYFAFCSGYAPEPLWF